MSRTGRPTNLTPELGEAICVLIRAGNFPETAAQSCGVGRTTYYEWMAKGREGDERYSDFADAVARARAEAEVDLVDIVKTAAQADPRTAGHAAWILKHLAKNRWGQEIRVRVASELERYLDVAERVLSQADFARLLAAWAVADDSEEEAGADQGDHARPVLQ